VANILPIVQVGDPVLRAIARLIETSELPGLAKLIDDMRDTMRAAPGVGLAAPQIGLSLAVAVIEDMPDRHSQLTPEQLAERERSAVPFHVLVNPTVEPVGDELVEAYEGCLSFKGFVMVVPRHRRVRVTARDEHGNAVTIEASGWYARILQHEIDHLNGIVCCDRMHSRTLATSENQLRFVR
jgi:peptide deformylase